MAKRKEKKAAKKAPRNLPEADLKRETIPLLVRDASKKPAVVAAIATLRLGGTKFGEWWKRHGKLMEAAVTPGVIDEDATVRQVCDVLRSSNLRRAVIYTPRPDAFRACRSTFARYFQPVLLDSNAAAKLVEDSLRDYVGMMVSPDERIHLSLMTLHETDALMEAAEAETPV